MCAGVVCHAAQGLHVVAPMLELCARVALPAAAYRLASGAIEIVVAHAAEDEFLRSHEFANLGPYKIRVLEALGDALASRWSPEELSARPSTCSARSLAMEILEQTALSTDRDAIRALGSWAACGVGLCQVRDENPRFVFPHV